MDYFPVGDNHPGKSEKENSIIEEALLRILILKKGFGLHRGRSCLQSDKKPILGHARGIHSDRIQPLG